MKNLVLKTVAITLAVIIAVAAALYFSVALFSPKTLAKIWDSAGNYSVAVKYYEKQYEKSGDISDLAILCAKLDAKNDSARAVKYFAQFTANSEFSAFCERQDTGNEFKMTSYEYYYGTYTVAEYYENGLSFAIIVAKKAVSKGYTKHNAFYVLLSEAETLTKADGEKIADEITGLKDDLSDAEKEIAEHDITIALSIE